MKSLRLGLIGLGNIGRHHATYLQAGKVQRCELVAVCSTTPAKMEAYRPLAAWTDARALIASGDWAAYCRFHLKKEHARNYPPTKIAA